MQTLHRLLRKVFGIYPGEGLRAFRFAKLAVLWAFGSSALDTLSDALFLEKMGAENLPITYLSIALGMVAISSLLLYLLRSVSPYRILLLALCFGAFVSIFAASYIPFHPPPFFWYLFKIASKIFFAVMIAVSWTFTDQYHDLQDAKRVYSIYSAAYFFGSILAGLSIHFSLETIGFTPLLTLSAISIFFAMHEAKSINRRSKAIHDDSSEGVLSGNRNSFGMIFKEIVRSKFTVVLLCLSLFIQLLLTVTEFNYMEAFDLTLRSGGEKEIASFLGKCRALISFANILIGFFFYSRFVRRSGLHNAILVTPLFFLTLYAGWLFSDALSFAVLGLIAVDGILFTIEDNCFNLLSSAVPSKIKSKVRIINDSFFEATGMLLSALLLFWIQSGSRALGFFLTLIVLSLALFIRGLYPKAILINLKENALHFEKKLKNWLESMPRREKKEARKEIVDALYSSSEKTSLLAMDALLELEDPSSLPMILQVAKESSTIAKIKLLEFLESSSFASAPRVLEAISAWKKEQNSTELNRRASLYLAKQGFYDEERAEEEIDHEDPLIRATAILAYRKSSDTLNRTIALKKLELMLISEHIDEIAIAIDILAEEKSSDVAEKVMPYLSHEALIVKRAAARTIAKVSDSKLSKHAFYFIEELENSRDNRFRLYMIEAIGNIGSSTTTRELLLASIHLRPNERRAIEHILVEKMGLKIVPLLLSLTKDLSLPERARILASKALGRLALPQLQANLFDILDVEIDRAYFYFYFAHTIQQQHPLYDLTMLEQALLSGYQSVIDFIIHLLGAAGSLEDPGLLVKALHSPNAKVHSHAVESLERTCHSRIFRLIAPLVDDLPLEEKMAACIKWYGTPPLLSLNELLTKLDLSPSLFDRLVALRLKVKLQMPHWREELRQQMKSSEEPLHQYAYELLETE